MKNIYRRIGLFKRVFDLMVSFTGLILISPFLLVTGILIKLYDRGPVFFRHERIGRNGRPFILYKFRSMKVEPDIDCLTKFEPGSTFRVTPVGKFIRKRKIDELPQLLNVLKGEMSIVGPRPEVKKWTEIYPLRWEKIHSICPGITDASSIIYRNEERLLSKCPDPEKLYKEVILPAKLDINETYVDTYTFKGDIKLILNTILSVFKEPHEDIEEILKLKNIKPIRKGLVNSQINKQKRLMILGASILQLQAIKQAKKMGHYVIAVDADHDAVGFRYSHKSILISTIDTDRILAESVKNRIDGILTLATDLPVRSVAKVAEKLNLNGISNDTAMCATHKYLMRKRLATNNVPVPKFFKVITYNEFSKIIDTFKDPFIVKPADNSGSRGIYLVKNKDESERAFRHAKKNSTCGEILVEEFMTGREVSVETISLNGKVHIFAITDKLTSGYPHFVELGHSQPAQFDDDMIKRIKEVAVKAVNAVGIENGSSHTEIKITDDGPKIVEIGARLGGDFITSDLVPLSTGINMIECCIKIALDEEPDIEVKFHRGSAIRFFNSSSGRIKSIKGIKEAEGIKGVKGITFVKSKGDIIGDLESSNDRIGWVIADGKDALSAISACEKAMEIIKISVDASDRKKKYQS